MNNSIKSKYVALSRTKKIVMWVIVGVIIAGIVVGSYFAGAFMPDDKFLELVKANDIWQNDIDSRLLQTEIYPIMYDHMFNNESGKKPKLLFLGYDGCLASIINKSEGKDYSAIYRLVDMGGKAYLGRAGGATLGDQATSTAPGWSTIFTGKWATETGVLDNSDSLNESTRSLIFTLGERGISSSFSVSWSTHFKLTYSKEIATAKAAAYPITYTLSSNDKGTIQAVKDSINSDIDATFCTLEFTDHQGHTSGYNNGSIYAGAFKDLETAASGILDEVFARPTYAEEDWLILIVSDHGGKLLNHGGTSYMESTNFFVVYDSIK